MKLNSKKLLLYLYPLAGEQRRASYDQVKLFLPDLTEAGRQSLVRLLIEKQFIFTDELTGEQRLTISSYGQTQLELDFPVLKKGEEICVSVPDKKHILIELNN